MGQTLRARRPEHRPMARTHYQLLDLHPSASLSDIRRSYRELSKQLHPDKSCLPRAVATDQFQSLNSAYATLSNPEQRRRYDQQIGYAQAVALRPLPNLSQPQTANRHGDEWGDRSLSSGEIFALFMMGVTLVGCFGLAVVLGFSHDHR
jgi:curved DNA-binding protein CbpA